MVEPQSSKLITRVRFPSSPPRRSRGPNFTEVGALCFNQPDAPVLLMNQPKGFFSVFGHQSIPVQPDGSTVHHLPLTRHHHTIGLLRAAQHQRGKWVMCPGKGEAIEPEHGQIGLPPHFDTPNILAPERAC